MQYVLIEVPEGQVTAALAALVGRGIPVRRLVDAGELPAPAELGPRLELFGGTLQGRAPAGTWTKAFGGPAVSVGQVNGDVTVWLMRGDGGAVTWFPTLAIEEVLLERGPAPEDLAGELGAEGVARVLAIAAQGDEVCR